MTKKLLTFLTLLTLFFGVGWAAEVPYKTLDISTATMSSYVNNYSTPFTATNDGFSWTIRYFNNGQSSSNWGHIRAANKNGASVATITTPVVIDKAITKVVVTVDQVVASDINSTTLYVASDGNFEQNLQTISLDVTQGTMTYAVPNPTANMFYKLAYDCKKTSANGTLRISKVEYYYNEGGSVTPTCATPTITINPASGPYYVGQTNVTATLACSNPTDATILYRLNNTGDWNTYSSAVTIPNTAAGDVSIQAKATKTDYNESSEATASVTFVNPPTTVANIAAFKQLSDDFTGQFQFAGDLTVTYINSTDKRYVWVKDNSGSSVIFNVSDLNNVNQGDIIQGGWLGKKSVYNGLYEITDVTGATIQQGSETVTPAPLSITDVTVANQAIYGKLSGVTITAVNDRQFTISDGENTVAGYNTYNSDTSIDIPAADDGFSYNIVGIVNTYKTTPQFTPVSFEKIIPEQYTVTCADATNGEISTDKEEYAEGETVTVTVTPAPGYELATLVYNDGSDHNITATEDVYSFEMPAHAVTITATFEKGKYLIKVAEGTVNGEVWVLTGDETAQGRKASIGDRITIRLVPNDNYSINTLTIKDADNNVIGYDIGDTNWTDNRYGTYYMFDMPGSEVTIYATFTNFFIIGEFNEKTWSAVDGVPMTFDGTDYTADVYVKNATGNFSFTDKLAYNSSSNPWGDISGSRHGATSDNFTNYSGGNDNGTATLQGGENSFQLPAGLYNIKVNSSKNQITVTPISVTFEFDPEAGEVPSGQEVTVSSNLYDLLHAMNRNVVKDNVTNLVKTETDGEYSVSVTINDDVTVTGQAKYGNIEKTATAEYTIPHENTSTQYQLIESTTDLIDGKKYIIVNEHNSSAYTGNGDNAIGITIENHITDVDPANVATMTLRIVDGKYTFSFTRDDVTYNVIHTSTTATKDNSFGSSSTESPTQFNISINNNGIFDIEADGKHLRANAATDFRFYDANSSGTAIQIYKQTGGTVVPKVATPTFSPAGGTYEGAQSVTISCATEGATIMYKTTEMDNYAQYTAAIPITASTTLTAYATKDGYTDSEPASAAYTITTPKVATPVFTPGEGVYTEALNVTITCATEGATILYSTDGETYTAYTAAIPVSETTTLYAKATKTDYDDSEIAEATYTFVAPGSGNYILVTQLSDIKAGREYVIVTSDHSKVMGSISGDHGTPVEGSTFNDDYSRMTPAEGANVLTLGGSEGAWTLKQKNNYYLWLEKSGTNIYSRASTYSSTSTYSMQLTISLNSDGTAAISTPSSTNRQIGYRTTDSYFGHWGNSNYNDTPEKYKKIYLYYKMDVESKTLAQIETSGVVGNEYTVSDQLIAVHYVAPQNDNYAYLWCKDQDNASICPTGAKEVDGVMQTDYMKDVLHAQTGDWDQSNWVVLKFAPAGKDNITSVQNAKGHYINPGAITGIYTDDANYTITMPAGEGLVGKLGNEFTYTPNVYCPANYVDANLNLTEQSTGAGPSPSGKYYFFMNPKIQEVAEISVAVWNGSGFDVPANNSAGLKGSVNVNWTFNGADVSSGLAEGKTYHFLAVLAPSAKAAEKTVYPLNLEGGNANVITAVADVNSSKTVAGVKYYNLAGMASDKPFDGVNIIVTTYTDGSRSSAKVLR